MAYDLLAPMLAEFAENYPKIDIEIVVTDHFQDISRHETDISVRIAHNVSDDVVGRKIIQYASALYASKSYIEANLHKAGPQGEGLVWTGWEANDSVPDWVKASPFPKAEIRHVSHEALMQLKMVRLGIGMSYLPCFFADPFEDLMQVPGTGAYLDRSIWLLLHADLRKTMRVRLLVDFLAKRLKDMRPLFLGPLA